jgi:glycosyltransferase involved in cell wall biosynthesis
LNYLFLHPNFPGQYKHIVAKLAREKKNQVVFICQRSNSPIPGVRKIKVRFVPVHGIGVHRYIEQFELSLYKAQLIWDVCHKLKAEGFIPDVMCAHPGWGDSLFLKDVFTSTPLLNYCEFFYKPFGADVDFDPHGKVALDTPARIRIKNVNNLINLDACDKGVTPTKWQHSVHPKEYQSKITVLHDGIDTDLLSPRKGCHFKLPDGTIVHQGDEIITYIARNLEPYRGFPSFMRAMEILLKERPECHVLIIGSDDVSYSRKLPDGKTYKETMLEEVSIDDSRVHFLGYLPYTEMIKVLLVSKAHVYLTHPFALSWSMLEAMALKCLVIGSATAPVEEVIEHGRNGLLVDFFSPQEIAKTIIDVFEDKNNMQDIREQARKTIVEKYALKLLLPRHIELINSLVDRGAIRMHTGIPSEMFSRVITNAARGNGMVVPADEELAASFGDKTVMVIAAAPRTGSTFLTNVLCRVTGLRYFRLSSAYSTNEHDIYLPSLCLAKARGCISQMHMKGTFHNAELMRIFGAKPVVLVRRIYDIVVSMAHDLREKEKLPGFGSGINGYSFIWQNEDVKNLDDQRLLDLVVDLIVPWYVNFIVSWDSLARNGNLEILWVTYEEMMADKKETINRVLSFAGLNASVDTLEESIAAKYRTFHIGNVGRGDTLLSAEQKCRIRHLCAYYPDTDFSKYGI